jgi:hypothetical protein
MASHRLIDSYLAHLAARLPAGTVDELADGLTETWQHHLERGLSAERAARAAIAEFGAATRIADEFVAQAPGRRTARLLLATGPALGVCWGTSLVAARVWTWPIPPAAGAAYVVALLVTVALLIGAATSRHSYRRTRLGGIGALNLVLLDAAMIGAVAVLAPMLVWPMGIAVAASLARIGLAIPRLPMALTA